MNDDEVSAAFEMLLEEIEATISALNARGAEAFGNGRHQDAAGLLEKVTHRTALRKEVSKLAVRWRQMEPEEAPVAAERAPCSPSPRRQQTERLRKGTRTPEEAFYQPILEELEALGGSARMARVLDGVGRRVKAILKAVDKQSLPSDSTIVRWRNTAQWARNTLKEQGLLSADSPHGTWEISPKGRQWLLEQKTKSSTKTLNPTAN